MGSKYNVWILVVVVVAVALAGCGRSTTVTGVSAPQTATVTTPAATHTSNDHSSALEPLSGGTECVVSYRGVLVIFKSTGYDVSPACTAQIRAGKAEGQAWIYPTGGQVSGSAPVCTLTTSMAMATIYDTTDKIGQSVCAGLTSAGWSQAN